MTRVDFVAQTLNIAVGQGYPVALNRDGYKQIDFGHKNFMKDT